MPVFCPPRRQLSSAIAPVINQQTNHNTHCNALKGAMFSRLACPLIVKPTVNTSEATIHIAITGHMS